MRMTQDMRRGLCLLLFAAMMLLVCLLVYNSYHQAPEWFLVLIGFAMVGMGYTIVVLDPNNPNNKDGFSEIFRDDS